MFSDKLNFIYIEIPKFDLNVTELGTKLEKWLYLLKHLEFLERLPRNLQEKIFQKVMDIAEIKKLEKEDRRSYEESLKHYRDLKNSLETHKAEGIKEGLEKGRVAMSIQLHKLGVDIEIISRSSGLSIERLREIFDENELT